MRRNQKNLRLYKKLCKEIWDSGSRQCEDCGCNLGVWDDEEGDYVPCYHNFHHTEGRITKSLDKDSIALLCFKCHAKDHGQTVHNAEWLK